MRAQSGKGLKTGGVGGATAEGQRRTLRRCRTSGTRQDGLRRQFQKKGSNAREPLETGEEGFTLGKEAA